MVSCSETNEIPGTDGYEQDIAVCLELQHLFGYDILLGKHEVQSIFCVAQMKKGTHGRKTDRLRESESKRNRKKVFAVLKKICSPKIAS